MKWKKGEPIDIDYARLNELMRKNGMKILREGNDDKFVIARDGDRLKLNIYGHLIYEEKRDEGERDTNPFYNFVIDLLKDRAKRSKREVEAMRNPRHLTPRRGAGSDFKEDYEREMGQGYQTTLAEDAKAQEAERHGRSGGLQK
jgi:hypothetical protein